MWPLNARLAWLSQPLWWRARHFMALHWPLFSLSAFPHPATAVVGTIGEGPGVTSSRLVRVDSDSHCGGGHDR
jgi:hypothetical protein